MRRLVGLGVSLMLGCAAPAAEPPRAVANGPICEPPESPPAAGGEPGSTPNLCAAASASPPSSTVPAPGQRLTLPLTENTLELTAGRWVVMVAAPAERVVTIGLSGPAKALRLFDVAAPRPLHRLRAGTAEDDRRLPTFVAFKTRESELEVAVIVDVEAPVTLRRSVADPSAIAPPAAEVLKAGGARPLVGMPFPIESGAGYFMEMPPRYLFVRADVAVALRQAFRQTRRRMRGRRIGLGDCTQWDGARPASDLGQPRHISHEGGRDVDIALPALEGTSKITRRCDGVLVDEGVLKCAPGTVRDLDATRLAYLLSLLIDGPTPGGRYINDARRRPGPTAMVETIYTDQAYIDEIRKVLPKLRAKRWIHDEAFGALGEEGLLRASPWHVDHVHVRFIGEKAKVPAVLDFDGPPAPPSDEPAATRAH